MIVVYHINNQISKVVSRENSLLSFDDKGMISEELYKLAVRFPESKIVWCEETCQQYLNLKEIDFIFHHNKMMLSYSPEEKSFMGGTIGYVEQSPFINTNKKVSYPTWQMSSLVGVVHASLLIEIKDKIKWDADFDYYLNSVAKVCMPLGLLCYSEPKLVKGFNSIDIVTTARIDVVFKFVKQHYKTRWLFLLLLNLVVYEKKFPLWAFLLAFFFKNRNRNTINLDTIVVHSSLKVVEKDTIDVIIPTIGRKQYLYDVLQDLAKQTHLPVNVIIVEQNPDKESVSELDYLKNQTWPFIIKHSFTHQAGACNARNLALNQLESEWVFLADDDIRFGNDFINKTFENINNTGVKAVSIKCAQENEKSIFRSIFQWGSFGSGCSFVESKALEKCQFDMGFEFGYGEDNDFGMQLRNQGHDVLYLPEPQILHLKAPMGGFRTKPSLKWQHDKIQPKPSPTVMLYQMKHSTKQQSLGYKTTLFFKYYNRQQIKNPIRYLINYRKQWNQSVFWANQLNKE